MTSPTSERRANRAWLWVCLILLAAGVVFWLFRPATQSPAGRRAAPSAAVGVARAETADMPVVAQGLGTVTPLATVVVRTQISGQLQSLGFTEGQVVKQGDFLAQIDPRPYQALLAQAQGALARDQALLRQARNDLRRYSTLNRQDSIARQQAENQVFVVQQDEGTVAADQGSVQAQLVNLAFCRIVSPVTGRVGLRQVDAGNYVTPGDTNGIVVVTQLQPISVIFSLPEDSLMPVARRVAEGARLQAVLFDRANSTQLAVGSLATFDNQIDTTTGTAKLRALFDNADNSLFPNQFVNLRLLVDTRRGAVTVPNAAVQTGAPGSFVYRVNTDDTVSVVAVKTGVADADRTQILSGIAAGDRVVIDGSDRLRDGAKIVVAGHTRGGETQDGAPPSGRRHHQ